MTAAAPDLTQVFFDACPEMFCIVDRDGRVHRANRAWRAVFGGPEPGEAGEILGERLPEDERGGFIERLRESNAVSWICHPRTAAGNHEPVSFTWGPDSGGFLHLIARRVAAQNASAQLEHRARALVRHTDLAIIDFSWGGEVVGWNPAAEALFGYTAAEAAGRLLYDMLDAGQALDRSSMAEALLRHGVLRSSARNRTKGGRVITCSWQIVLLRDEEGAPFALSAVVQDITALEEQRRALEERTRLLQAMLENVPVILWAIDRDGIVTASKGSGLRSVGLADDEVVGRDVFEMYADTPQLWPPIRDALAGRGSVMSVEIAGRHFEGHYIPLRSEAGEVTGMLGVSLDVTERARLEGELRDHIRMLEEQRSIIRALSTPVLQLWDEVLALPVIGHVDAERSEAIMEALLGEIVRTQSRYAILDVTGVATMDTTTVHHLARLLRAVGLLGAEGLLTGVGPAVARSLVELGVDLGQVPTAANLRAGLQRCLQGLGGRGGAGARSARSARRAEERGGGGRGGPGASGA